MYNYDNYAGAYTTPANNIGIPNAQQLPFTNCSQQYMNVNPVQNQYNNYQYGYNQYPQQQQNVIGFGQPVGNYYSPVGVPPMRQAQSIYSLEAYNNDYDLVAQANEPNKEYYRYIQPVIQQQPQQPTYQNNQQFVYTPYTEPSRYDKPYTQYSAPTQEPVKMYTDISPTGERTLYMDRTGGYEAQKERNKQLFAEMMINGDALYTPDTIELVGSSDEDRAEMPDPPAGYSGPIANIDVSGWVKGFEQENPGTKINIDPTEIPEYKPEPPKPVLNNDLEGFRILTGVELELLKINDYNAYKEYKNEWDCRKINDWENKCNGSRNCIAIPPRVYSDYLQTTDILSIYMEEKREFDAKYKVDKTTTDILSKYNMAPPVSGQIPPATINTNGTEQKPIPQYSPTDARYYLTNQNQQQGPSTTRILDGIYGYLPPVQPEVKRDLLTGMPMMFNSFNPAMNNNPYNNYIQTVNTRTEHLQGLYKIACKYSGDEVTEEALERFDPFAEQKRAKQSMDNMTAQERDEFFKDRELKERIQRGNALARYLAAQPPIPPQYRQPDSTDLFRMHCAKVRASYVPADISTQEYMEKYAPFDYLASIKRKNIDRKVKSIINPNYMEISKYMFYKRKSDELNCDLTAETNTGNIDDQTIYSMIGPDRLSLVEERRKKFKDSVLDPDNGITNTIKKKVRERYGNL